MLGKGVRKPNPVSKSPHLPVTQASPTPASRGTPSLSQLGGRGWGGIDPLGSGPSPGAWQGLALTSQLPVGLRRRVPNVGLLPELVQSLSCPQFSRELCLSMGEIFDGKARSLSALYFLSSPRSCKPEEAAGSPDRAGLWLAPRHTQSHQRPSSTCAACRVLWGWRGDKVNIT